MAVQPRGWGSLLSDWSATVASRLLKVRYGLGSGVYRLYDIERAPRKKKESQASRLLKVRELHTVGSRLLKVGSGVKGHSQASRLLKVRPCLQTLYNKESQASRLLKVGSRVKGQRSPASLAFGPPGAERGR